MGEHEMQDATRMHLQMQFARAGQLIHWRRYKEALQELEQILRIEPENADAMATIANVHQMQGDYEQAMNWAGMALRYEPDHRLAWYVRVCVYYETDREKEFSEAVEHALRIDPDDPHYYL